MGLDYNKSFINYCSSSYCWFYFISVKDKHQYSFLLIIKFRRAKFEAELKAMQWLIKWEELTTRTLLHNGVATPSFNKLSASQKVIRNQIEFILFYLYSFEILIRIYQYRSQ
jgi:hypothetical protein